MDEYLSVAVTWPLLLQRLSEPASSLSMSACWQEKGDGPPSSLSWQRNRQGDDGHGRGGAAFVKVRVARGVAARMALRAAQTVRQRRPCHSHRQGCVRPLKRRYLLARATWSALAVWPQSPAHMARARAAPSSAAFSFMQMNEARIDEGLNAKWSTQLALQ